MLTQLEAIRKALLARGEQEVRMPSIIKWHVFSRSYLATRDANGILCPNLTGAKYWFIGKRVGNLRAGATVGTAKRISPIASNALVREGRALP